MGDQEIGDRLKNFTRMIKESKAKLPKGLTQVSIKEFGNAQAAENQEEKKPVSS